uniref:Uncharacterized protein n=1 Tax=Arundo donax TaxID=35708 RepID=A0A0A9DGG8_ARUDO
MTQALLANMSYHTTLERRFTGHQRYMLSTICGSTATSRHLCFLIRPLEATLWCSSTIHMVSFRLQGREMTSGPGFHPTQAIEIAYSCMVNCMH